MGSPVVDVQRPGAPTNIDAERLPGKRLLKNPLSEIAREKQSIRFSCSKRGEKS